MPFVPRLIVAVTACAAVVVSNPQLAAQARGAFLGDLTWPEAQRRLRDAPMVILPFGAGAKEHGPHLPLSTDRLVVEYLSALAVDS